MNLSHNYPWPYSHVSVVKSSVMKWRLEELYINRYWVTIALVDVVNMYPSIKLATIRKVVNKISIKITAATKNTINLCL